MYLLSTVVNDSLVTVEFQNYCGNFNIALFQESDDEPREEKDHFVAQLYKYMEECNTPINKGPTIASRDLDLYKLFRVSVV